MVLQSGPPGSVAGHLGVAQWANTVAGDAGTVEQWAGAAWALLQAQRCLENPGRFRYKYRAVYIADGKRVVGFDNERGKGDHCHLDGRELPYRFTSVEQLVEDFIAAVAARRAP